MCLTAEAGGRAPPNRGATPGKEEEVSGEHGLVQQRAETGTDLHPTPGLLPALSMSFLLSSVFISPAHFEAESGPLSNL